MLLRLRGLLRGQRSKAIVIVAVHQPEYLPCLALVAKIARADKFVLLDDVQFNREAMQHRARICARNGTLAWLTIPYVHQFPQRIDEVEVADPAWRTRHVDVLRTAYRDAPHLGDVLAALDDVYGRDERRVGQIALRSMNAVLGAFGISRPAQRAADLGVTGARGDRVLAICQAVGATCYLAGRSGAAYLDRAAFAAARVDIAVSTIDPPIYRDGLPRDAHAKGLTALDAWAHLGQDAKRWLRAAL